MSGPAASDRWDRRRRVDVEAEHGGALEADAAVLGESCTATTGIQCGGTAVINRYASGAGEGSGGGSSAAAIGSHSSFRSRPRPSEPSTTRSTAQTRFACSSRAVQVGGRSALRRDRNVVRVQLPRQEHLRRDGGLRDHDREVQPLVDAPRPPAPGRDDLRLNRGERAYRRMRVDDAVVDADLDQAGTGDGHPHGDRRRLDPPQDRAREDQRQSHGPASRVVAPAESVEATAARASDHDPSGVSTRRGASA
jgi:hypothetical protein